MAGMGGREGAVEDIAETAVPTKPAKRPRPSTDPGIVVKGVSDVWVKLARCCTPVPGDPIIGFVTRGSGVSVHRKDCGNVESLSQQPERNRGDCRNQNEQITGPGPGFIADKLVALVAQLGFPFFPIGFILTVTDSLDRANGSHGDQGAAHSAPEGIDNLQYTQDHQDHAKDNVKNIGYDSSVMIHLKLLLIKNEYLFNGHCEIFRDFIGQHDRGIVAAVFQGTDGLAGDTQGLRHFILQDSPLFSDALDSVFHRAPPRNVKFALRP
jgi:hypothetical protein